MKFLPTFVAVAAVIGASAISFAALAQSTPAPAPIGEMKMDKPAAAGAAKADGHAEHKH